MKTLCLSVFVLLFIHLEAHAAVLGSRIQWQKLLQYHSNPQKSTELLDKYRVPFVTAKGDPKTKLRKPSNSEKLQKPELFADPFMQRSYAPASPYQGGYPAMYPAQQPAAAPQYMYPQAAAPAYAPSPYQAPPSYYPAQQGLPSYAPQEQQQAYEQQGQQELAASPPAPKLPELMSTLVAMSQKNQGNNQQQQQQQQCMPCNTCNQCSAMPSCVQCPVCQSTSCAAASSLPLIPKGLRPLWELWNEKTADMNSMEMSALILSPVPKLPPTKKSSSLTEKAEGSGVENSEKRSHVKIFKTKKSKSVKKTHDASKHSVSKANKSDKAIKKNTKRVSKAKHI